MELSYYHSKVAERAPLVHSITNYVTVNDVANILLAAGASPIMADEPADAVEITAICDALVLNIGTLNSQTIPAMFKAGARANGLGHPVILDPVGVGASALRTQTALDLLEQLQVRVIRGNISEIKALATGAGDTHGVDAAIADAISENNLSDIVQFACQYAKRSAAVIVVSGAIDIVATGERAFVARNGHAWMARITGSGCMLSALVAAFVAANPDAAQEAALAAVTVMGVAGELAYQRVQRDGGGTLSYRCALIDAVSLLTSAELDGRAKIEEW